MTPELPGATKLYGSRRDGDGVVSHTVSTARTDTSAGLLEFVFRLVTTPFLAFLHHRLLVSASDLELSVLTIITAAQTVALI
ncbi:MAG: hypothetical protein ACLP8X_24750 [Streptosporangiaceae bacterium]